MIIEQLSNAGADAHILGMQKGRHGPSLCGACRSESDVVGVSCLPQDRSIFVGLYINFSILLLRVRK